MKDNSEKLRILVVEDNPADAQFIQIILKKNGQYQADYEWVKSAAEGKKILAESEFDLVLLDLSLPDSNGIDTFTIFKNAAPEIPILLLTGRDDQNFALELLGRGAQDYLSKDELAEDKLWRAILYSLERKNLELNLTHLQKRLENLVIERTNRLSATQSALENKSKDLAETQQRLSQTEKLYRSLVSSISDAAMVLNSDQFIEPLNHAAYEFLNIENTNGDKIKIDQLSEAQQKLFYMIAGDTLRNGEMKNYEFEKPEDGRRWFELRVYPTADRLLCLCSDITERKQAEEQLKESLGEKEVLLQEIHHRVKNNLQIVSSFLSLQERRITDQAAKEMLSVSRTRIKTMALVHEVLYDSENLAHIDFNIFIDRLVQYLYRIHGESANNVDFEIICKDVHMPINQSIPCALVLNELVSNSLIHAFPDHMAGVIKISMENEQGQYILSIEDNGIGAPDITSLHTETTLGLRIVGSLVEQLHGKCDFVCIDGCRFRISFPINPPT